MEEDKGGKEGKKMKQMSIPISLLLAYEFHINIIIFLHANHDVHFMYVAYQGAPDQTNHYISKRFTFAST